jgi:hypothetical protein
VHAIADPHVGAELLCLLAEFARNNPHFMTLTRERARSYWAAHYRCDWPAMQEYPALIALDSIVR